MKWINEPINIDSKAIRLEPLSENHFEELIKLSKNKQIWQHYTLDGSDTSTLLASLEDALLQRELGKQYPFVINLKNENKIIGSTRFLNIEPEHKKLEIGWTWLHPNYWATAINTRCKLLLLTHCFEKLLARRVQLKTDEHNIRSRKAIEKIGGKFEGILRNDMIKANGNNRNSAYYSIIEEDWITTKQHLLHQLQ